MTKPTFDINPLVDAYIAAMKIFVSDEATANGTGYVDPQDIFDIFSPIKKDFLSTGQTITLAGLLSFTHLLGQKPKFITAFIKCTAIDRGFAVGDEIFIDLFSLGQNSWYVDSGNTTQFHIRINDTKFATIADKATGNKGAINVTKWDLYARAFA